METPEYLKRLGYAAEQAERERRRNLRSSIHAIALRYPATSGDGSINAHLARTVLGDYAKGQTDAQQGD